MSRFYVSASQVVGDNIYIEGDDFNHVKNVLRTKPGEGFIICADDGKTYDVTVMGYEDRRVVCKITAEIEDGAELPCRITLYQGLPKKDKMELIIQKAVELGASEIVPVMMKRTIVKLDDPKKEAKKTERWQAIAYEAAKQSGRGIIPKVGGIVSFKEALDLSKENDYNVIPYEKAEDIVSSREVMMTAAKGKSVGIFIGPEGGIEEEELKLAMDLGVKPVSLGRRILRTETAGLCALSVLMFEIESSR